MKNKIQILITGLLLFLILTGTAFTALAYNNDYTGKEFKFKLTKDAINYDEMIVLFIEDATYGKDMYDISVFWGPELNVTSLVPGGCYLSVDAKPFNGTKDTTRLGVRVKSSGSYSLSFCNASAFGSGLPIQLIDSYTQTVIDLKANPVYNFAVDLANSATYGDNRFYIMISAMPVTTTQTPTTSTDTTSSSSSSGTSTSSDTSTTSGTTTSGSTSGSTTEVTPTPEVQQDATITLYPTVTHDYTTLASNVNIVTTSSVQVYDLRGKLVLSMQSPAWDNRKVVVDLNKLPKKTYTVIVKIGTQKAQVLRCIKN